MGSECGHLVLLLEERGLVKRMAKKLQVTPSCYGFFGLQDRSYLPTFQESAIMERVLIKEEIGLPFSPFNEGGDEKAKKIFFDSSWSV
jgi:hypothetical protein